MWMQSIDNYDEAASTTSVEAIVENRVDALRSLAMLMLREVESMGRTISPGDGLGGEEFCLQNEIQRYEAELIRRALVKAGGRQRLAARLLRIKATTLHSKIKKYEINWRVVGIESEFVS